MERQRKRLGFAFVELLLALVIMSVLAGFGFAAVYAYTRSTTKLQYDGYAREIFVAAQNHLAMAAAQNYMGRSNYGIPETDDDGDETHVYYFVCQPALYDSPDRYGEENEVLRVILPQYAIDETVRSRGHFILRYHKDAAQMLDVFYWENTGQRFSLDYRDNVDYAAFLKAASLGVNGSKDTLQNYGDNHSVVGYYGGFGDASGSGSGAESLKRGNELQAPSIVVTNGDRLTVTVTNNNPNDPTKPDVAAAKIELIIKGLTSDLSKTVPVSATPGTSSEIVLDDVTISGKHFYDQFCQGGPENLIPGENIEIQAVIFSDSTLTNVAYSSKQTTNSLFADDTDVDGHTAKISNIRHLENLSFNVSDLNNSTRVDPAHPEKVVTISKAEQTTDLKWTDFLGGTETVCAKFGGAFPNSGPFLPVTPEYALTYDGQNHSISNIAASGAGEAGLFGTLNDSTVQNLKLVDFTITSTDGNAGALAATASNTTFTNVIAVNSRDTDSATDPTVTGRTSTGGLIGAALNCTVTKCAAALVVQSSDGDAGGLIGTVGELNDASDTTEITACYAGGHTDGNASYSSTDYNVTGGGNVGGLVGSFNGKKIEYSYSTCSVSGTGTTGIYVGGLLGNATVTDTVNKCYATGLVQGSNAGAFAGNLSCAPGNCTNCTYYEIVNEKAGGNPDGSDGYEYLSAFGVENAAISIQPFDSNTTQYNTFIGNPSAWTAAVPYDTTLNRDFKGQYPYQSAKRLGADVADADFVSTHYGDWPAEETFVINTTP